MSTLFGWRYNFIYPQRWADRRHRVTSFSHRFAGSHWCKPAALAPCTRLDLRLLVSASRLPFTNTPPNQSGGNGLFQSTMLLPRIGDKQRLDAACEDLEDLDQRYCNLVLRRSTATLLLFTLLFNHLPGFFVGMFRPSLSTTAILGAVR